MSLETPQLPLELLEDVLSFLQADVLTLKAASLVCHAWMCASRRYLFRSIEFSSRIEQGWIALPFALGRHIKHIAIRRLEEEVTGGRIRMLSHFATELGSLELTDIVFHDFVDLTSVIASFRGLHTLTLSRVQWNENSFSAAEGRELHFIPSSLSTLRIYYLDFQTFVGWMLKHQQQISAWHLGPITPEVKVVCAEYLLHIRRGLRELGIVFDNGGVHYGDSHYKVKGPTPEGSKEMQRLASRFESLYGVDVGMVMRCAEELRVVRLYKFLSFNEMDRSAARMWVPKLLVSVESTKLEKVVLDVEVESLREAVQSQMNWDFLDEILNTDVYKRAHTVQFNVLTDISPVAFDDWISVVLPITYSRGVVRVTRDNKANSKSKLF